jgi:putative addiction module CopG family antidote
MQITLRMPELEKFVEEQVRAGAYRSPEDVVNGALALLRGQAQTSAAEVEELRAAIAVGMGEADRGLSEPWNADEIAAEVERRMIGERKTG